jgi:hypothetical protein
VEDGPLAMRVCGCSKGRVEYVTVSAWSVGSPGTILSGPATPARFRNGAGRWPSAGASLTDLTDRREDTLATLDEIIRVRNSIATREQRVAHRAETRQAPLGSRANGEPRCDRVRSQLQRVQEALKAAVKRSESG